MAVSDRRNQLLQEMYAAHWPMARTMMASRGAFTQIYGLNRAQAEALFAIKYRGCSSIGELAKTLGVTSGAATQTVEALEDHKLVARRRQEDDRRVVHIDFTAEGQAMLKQLAEHHFQRLEELLADLTDDDLSELIRIEKKIMASLHKREVSS